MQSVQYEWRGAERRYREKCGWHGCVGDLESLFVNMRSYKGLVIQRWRSLFHVGRWMRWFSRAAVEMRLDGGMWDVIVAEYMIAELVMMWPRTEWT
jgi:hypothetical protein